MFKYLNLKKKLASIVSSLIEIMKPKQPFSEQFQGWIRDLPQEEKGIFKRDGKKIFCSVCCKLFIFSQKFQLTQHRATDLHKTALKRANGQHQSLINQSQATESFDDELCKAFLAADIPWKKLENPVFKAFLENHCKRKIPSEWKIRTTCLQKTFTEVIEDIRKEIGSSRIWVGVDETTDKCGRFIANVMVGALNGEIANPHLLMCQQLEATNNATVSQLVMDALHFLWPGKREKEINEKFVIFLSDAVPYMKKAGENLKKAYPGLLHVTCLAHGLHRVAEIVRSSYSDVDKLMASVKAVFKKAPYRVRAYKETNPHLPLPPEPILTRWGTWLEAANFYAVNFDAIKQVVDALDSEQAQCIKKAQRIFSKDQVKLELADLSANFTFLAQDITRLEERNVPLVDAVKIISSVRSKLASNDSRIGEKVFEKLNRVLTNNADFATVELIADVLNGKRDVQVNLSPSTISSLKFCPLTSVELERSFSMLKSLLSDRRTNFTMQNLEMALICHFELCKAE